MKLNDRTNFLRVQQALPGPSPLPSDIPPTDRQLELIATIGRLTRENRAAPTIREVAAAMGINSPNGVMCHVRALQRKGVIEIPTGRQKSRWLRLKNQKTCPCCGQTIAKEPA